MCGIAGIVRFDGERVSEEQLRRMADALVHRGPDDAGVYVSPDGVGGLAFRRLSIIDLAGGHQPMSNEAGDVWVCFNGEIYNFVDLRASLRAAGHRFVNDSDTEVIAHGYEEHAEGILDRLRGMFAIGIWDERAATLTLARDRIGKKPLYYYYDGQRLAFASERKALDVVPWVPHEIDEAALGQYLAFGYIPAPRTIHRGVRKLPAGHRLRLTRAGASVERYWDLPEAPPVTPYASLDEAVDDFERELERAVTIRMRADVPLGAFLSGGIDSSLIVALMARNSGRRISTFSVGFSEGWYNELPYARKVAEHLGTDHHEEVIAPDVASTIERLAAHMDEPFADSSLLPTYLVCGMARRSVTVALTGDGGDEAFAGYDHYIDFLRNSRWARFAGTGALGWVARRALPFATRGETAADRFGRRGADAYAATVSVSSARMRAGMIRPEMRASFEAGFDEARNQIYGAAGWSEERLLRDAQRIDLTRGYFPGDIAVKVDMASMAHGLEVRAPLLDHVLLERAVGLPREYRVKHQQGKLVLRALAARMLPPEIVSRPKHGFAMPVSGWLRKDLASIFSDTVLASDARVHRYLDAGTLRRLYTRHREGKVDRGAFLHLVLALELWLRAHPAGATA